MKNECAIVRDLLPLYADHLTSPETDEYIKEHLENCEECGKYWQEMNSKETPEEELPLKELSRTYKKKKGRTALLAASIAVSILVTLFAFLTAPRYLTCPDAVQGVEEGPDTVKIQFSEKVSHFQTNTYTDAESGDTVQELECWNTLLDDLWKTKRETKYIELPKDQIWYSPNNGQENTQIYGASDYAGSITLRRLTLNFYLLISAILSAGLLGFWFVMKKVNAGDMLFRAFLLPFSWCLATILVEQGMGGATYSLLRDFQLICILCISLFVTFLLLYEKHLEKKSV